MPKQLLHIFLSLLIVMTFSLPAAAEEIEGRYVYTLSDFSGPQPFNWVRVHAGNGEVFVVNPSDQAVHIYNRSGMEIFHFAGDRTMGDIIDIAVADNGDIYVLSGPVSHFSITRCNYRGEPLAILTMKDFPGEFTTGFAPEAIFSQQEKIFLADKNTMKVAVIDRKGSFKSGYDLADLIGLEEKKRVDSAIFGLNVDGNGNILFTIPTNFAAYVVSPDKKVQSFGVRGSAPGKFNVIAGITGDDKGYYLVDTLRCVVMVFDKDFKFRTEFGYRGLSPENLIAPRELAVDSGLLYVTQSRGRGINVYRVTGI